MEYEADGQGATNVWRFIASFLAGAVMALAAAWATGMQARASNRANVSMQIRQLVKSQQDEEQEIKDLTVGNWSNQQAIAVLTQRFNDLVQKLTK